MSPSLPRARRALALMFTGLVVLGATALPASADEASAYLARIQRLNEPCSGTWYRTSQTGLTANPSSWHSLALYVRTDTGGNFETNVYREDGVTKFKRDYSCKNSSNYRRLDNPTKYAHRFVYKNFLCWGGSCEFFDTTYGSWVPGL